MMVPDAYTTGEVDGMPNQEIVAPILLHFQIRLTGSLLVPSNTTEKEHYAYQIEVCYRRMALRFAAFGLL
jgi:hypothetical protein